MPRPRTLPPHEQIEREQAAEGLSDAQIGDRYGVKASAIQMSRRRWRDQRAQSEEAKIPPLPWTVADRHGHGGLYKMFLAYRKWKAGHQVTSEEYRQAMTVQGTADELGMVVSYDRDRGFVWVERQPEDGDAMFVKR